MSEPAAAPALKQPAICLNMVVRNAANTVEKTLDAVAPHISSWVIVDAGSSDGTPELVAQHMANLNIPGELYERPWRNLGLNRTEALALAQHHGDYIWIVDAEDTVVGTPDFTRLGADIYWLRHGMGPDALWRAQLIRDGARVVYDGVNLDYAVWDNDAYIDARLGGTYYIDSPGLGAPGTHSRYSQPGRDHDRLLAEVQRNPKDAQSVFCLAQSYLGQGDFVNARTWFARRVEMGGWAQEVYVAMWRLAETMETLRAPWAEVAEAYLKAWEFRPTRAESLYAIAYRYRIDQRYRLGYQFARHAAEIPFPEQDHLFIREDVYAWRAADEQAVCASWIGKQAEAFTLWRRLLARPDLPEPDRQRIAANRDVCVPTMLNTTSAYPDALVHTLQQQPPTDPNPAADVTVSLITGPDRKTTEHTLNSFLNCCLDISRITRFVAIDTGLTTQDRATLLERYGFLEFTNTNPKNTPGAQIAHLRTQITTRFWLHLGQGWRFFTPENLITRLTAVLDAEPQAFQVGINLTDATELTATSAAEHTVRRTPEAGRYLITTTTIAHGPAMLDTTRLDQAGGLHHTDPDPIAELHQRATAHGLHTASLDEVLCLCSLDFYRQSPWAVPVADVINELLAASNGRHFAELSTGGPSPYFPAVIANSKVSLASDLLAAHPPGASYDVIFVDTRREPQPSLDVIERCLAKLSTAGALVVHGSNPPTAEQDHGWRGVAEFRIRHPRCEVFTVGSGWGCTVIRPSRRAAQALNHTSVVDIAWLRRHLYADPYLAGSASLVSRTQVLNVLISAKALDRYLEIGIADGTNLASIIAPIRHSVDPHPELGGASALYPMTSDEFFVSDLGLARYDLVFIDGLHTEEQCRRDLENALTRLAEHGWIVAHDANPPTEWHQRPVEQFQQGFEWNGTVWKALVRFRSAHPEFELYTLDLDWGCALLRRRPANVPARPMLELPETLDWAFFAPRRQELLNLIPGSAEELRKLLC